MDKRRQGAQRRWDQRRAKTRLNLRLSPQTRSLLANAARERGVPMCELAERLIRTGLSPASAPRGESAALPSALRTALEEQARRTEERLAKLLVRSIVASDTTRRLLFAHMARRWGGADAIQPVHDSARTASINALRERGWQEELGE
jgi:hypothetical protein